MPFSVKQYMVIF